MNLIVFNTWPVPYIGKLTDDTAAIGKTTKFVFKDDDALSISRVYLIGFTLEEFETENPELFISLRKKLKENNGVFIFDSSLA